MRQFQLSPSSHEHLRQRTASFLVSLFSIIDMFNFGAKIIKYIGNKKKKLLYFTSVTDFF